jgi:phosphoenolpyruvate carboxylase
MEADLVSALVSLVAPLGQPLVEALITARFADKEQQQKKILAMASFIEAVSESLCGMHQKLSNNNIPTVEGNRLKEHLKNFADVIGKSQIDEKYREELKTILPKLEAILTNAQFEDEVIRGTVLTYEPASRTRLLDELQRTASRLKGMSDILKVVG